jgi:lipopolysaccharide/colanic/teichoic acid biosynthesis glycosyltransferase
MRHRQILKRSFDAGLCVLAAPLLVPLCILIAVAIRVDSHGPVFFVQRRAGKGGRVFNIIKFRTMHHGLDPMHHEARMQRYVRGETEVPSEATTTFKPFRPDEVTRVGGFLRETSLDELPQLVNVIKGDMSLVGPRPNVCYEVDAYKRWHRARLGVLPGITGLAQLRGRSRTSFDEIVRNDIEYITNQTLSLDVKILWWTIAAVISRNGAE